MNTIARQVKIIIGDEVGEFVGEVTVKKNCELIGTTVDDLSYSHLPDLTRKIEKFVTFYTGAEIDSSVSAKIIALETRVGPAIYK